MRKNLMIFAFIFVLILLFAGCQGNKPSETEDKDTVPTDAEQSVLQEIDEPDITGEVIEISEDNVIRILVDSKSDAITGQIWVSLNEETIFIDAEGNSFTPEDTASLFEVGQTASFLSDGMIMESYPMQTSAQYVFVD